MMGISKPIRLTTFFMLVTSALLSSAYAQDPEIEQETRINVIVAGEVGDQATRIDWTSNDPNIDFMNMQIGESQSIVDDSGRNILVTKEEGGLRFNVDGETIVVPDMGDMHGAHMTMIAADGTASAEHDINIDIIDGNETSTVSSATLMAAPTMPGAMIITDEPLDAATQESIRSILQSAGQSDVNFVSNNGNDRQVKIIRKQVEVTH